MTWKETRQQIKFESTQGSMWSLNIMVFILVLFKHNKWVYWEKNTNVDPVTQTMVPERMDSSEQWLATRSASVCKWCATASSSVLIRSGCHVHSTSSQHCGFCLSCSWPSSALEIWDWLAGGHPGLPADTWVSATEESGGRLGKIPCNTTWLGKMTVTHRSCLSFFV